MKSRAIFKDVTKACANCHRIFTFRPMTSKPDQICCSIECSNMYRAGITNHHNPPVIRQCAHCRKIFEPSRPDAVCCSAVCSNHFRHRGITNTLCEECGNIFEHNTIRARRFCSHFCANRFINKQRYGSTHKKRLYYGPNWKVQRLLALKRDHYCCQHCGATRKHTGKHPHVHHIKPFREFLGNYELANHLSNLLCLCQKCHPLAENGKIWIQPHLI